MTVTAQKTLMVASLGGAEYALLDTGSGLTSCSINYADDLTTVAWNALVRDKLNTDLRMVNHLLRHGTSQV